MMTALLIGALILVDNPTREEQIRSPYAAWDEAYMAHGVVRLASLLDSEFVLFTDSGTEISRADYIARLWKAELPEVYETTVLRMSFSGSRATAWTRELAKESGSELAEHRYEDTWVLREGRWKMILSKSVGAH